MLERFTQPARDVVVDAQAQARRLGHREIAAEHLLLAVVAETDGLGARVLREFGLQPDELSRDVAALEKSLRQALALKHKHIGSEHILLGLLADDRTAAASTLRRLGIAAEAVRARLRQELRSAA
jgi:ATP-dependent Clp protease ATP-binding subunit ClpC